MVLNCAFLVHGDCPYGGAPLCYRMAPEVLSYQEYTYSVDIFSYGISLLEMMMRDKLLPGDFPRTEDFGIDPDEMRVLAKPQDVPVPFLDLALSCCK